MTILPNVSIKHDKNDHRRQKKSKRQVFKGKASLALSTTHSSKLSKPPLNDIEGTIEMQKMFLQGLMPVTR
jgi:hypothetical protein